MPPPPSHTHTSGNAVLDIFNKLKQRYKKCTFHSLPYTSFHFFLINCDKHSFIFPPQNETTIQSMNQCWISIISHLETDWKAESSIYRANSCPLDCNFLQHFMSLMSVPRSPNVPTRTHTCYMSAGTSDKTEGLDWDRIHQRPQNTFQCWSANKRQQVLLVH